MMLSNSKQNYKYDRANQQDGEKHGRQVTCKQKCQCKSESAIVKKPSNDLTRWNRFITGIDPFVWEYGSMIYSDVFSSVKFVPTYTQVTVSTSRMREPELPI